MSLTGRATIAVGMLAVMAFAGAACGKSTPAASGAITLRLGYFPNLTHAPAMIGLDKGFFKQELGSNVSIDAKTFNAGPDVVTAIFADALDISYIGPNPSINAFQKSQGKAVKIISGAASGGAALVVKSSITSAADLKGKKIASPQLGNTQDIALRAWLKSQGLSAPKEGGGDVEVVAQPNAQTLDTFKAGAIDGAWVPEPWATRLVVEGGGKKLVDEASLWPDGKFVTTDIVVRTAFLEKYPNVVRQFLRGHIKAVDFANSNPAEAQAVVNYSLKTLTGKSLKPEIMTEAWKHLRFTVDPVASSLRSSAQHAKELGFLPSADVAGIFDLDLLNADLDALGKAKVSA
jgi:NitT/TauT family transport system substrate-binding protein